jgi:hypothetical protein
VLFYQHLCERQLVLCPRIRMRLWRLGRPPLHFLWWQTLWLPGRLHLLLTLWLWLQHSGQEWTLLHRRMGETRWLNIQVYQFKKVALNEISKYRSIWSLVGDWNISALKIIKLVEIDLTFYYTVKNMTFFKKKCIDIFLSPHVVFM